MGRAAALALLALAGAAGAQGIEADAEAVGPVEAGIFCTEKTGERIEAPGTVSGFIDLVDEVELVARTLVVPTAPGLTFGYRAAVLADAPDAVQVVRHPAFRGLGAREQIMPAPLRRGATRLGLYTFDHDYERVEGPWSFEIRQGGKRLLRVAFRAVPPEAAPHLVGLCDGPPPISEGPLTPSPPAG
jgi:hypothetical protein